MPKKKKRIFAVLLSAILVVALTGCSKLGSIINENLWKENQHYRK